MRYFLDTSAIMHYIKADAIYNYLKDSLDIFNSSNEIFISFVTKAELHSILSRAPLDRKKQLHFNQIIEHCNVVPLDNAILEAYVEIDTFSHGKHLTKTLVETVDKMGKNDLWIAATAKVSNAILITVDSDFTHLDGSFIDLILLSTKGKIIQTK